MKMINKLQGIEERPKGEIHLAKRSLRIGKHQVAFYGISILIRYSYQLLFIHILNIADNIFTRYRTHLFAHS